MALIKLGAVVTGISGKIGGQTFANGPAGLYLKNRGTYTLRQNSKRNVQQVLFQQSVKAWSGLSASLKQDWRTAALDFPYTDRLGNEKFLSGFQLFTRQSINYQLAGQTGAVPVAVKFVWGATHVQYNQWTEDNLNFRFEDFPVGTVVRMYATKPTKSLDAFSDSVYRFVGNQTLLSDDEILNWWTPLNNLYGEPTLNDEIKVRFDCLDPNTFTKFRTIYVSQVLYEL